MKTYLLLLLAFLSLSMAGCSDDDGFPRKADISITISASDDSRFSHLETKIFGTNLDLETESYSNVHLPYWRVYTDVRIPRVSGMSISYADYSEVPIGGSFTPYTLEILVEIDGETAISEEHTIANAGDVVSTNLSFVEYFAAH